MEGALGHLEKDAMAMTMTEIARDSRNDIGIGKTYGPDGKLTKTIVMPCSTWPPWERSEPWDRGAPHRQAWQRRALEDRKL